MEEAKLAFFALGTLAFLVNVYFAVQNPELVEAPIGEEQKVDREHPLKKFDDVATYVMWGGWGIAALIIYVDKGGYLDGFGL